MPGILPRARVKKWRASPSQAGSQKSGTDSGADAGRLRTLHFAAEDLVTDEYTLTLGAKFLLWGFPLALVILVVAETLLDTWWREPRR